MYSVHNDWITVLEGIGINNFNKTLRIRNTLAEQNVQEIKKRLCVYKLVECNLENSHSCGKMPRTRAAFPVQ